MEFSLLGGVEAYHAGVRVELGRRHERRLLALLLLEPGRIVATDRLLDLMWDGDPPPTARATLHTYVSRLRKRLAPYAVELHQRSAGYLIDVDPGQVDLHRFRQGLAAAREVADPAERARLLSQALELWRGLPMAGTASDALSHRVCAEPVDDWLAAVELHAEAELELGHHDRVGTELARLAEEHPTRERLVAALMLALYRDGRQSEALAVYTDVRRRLVADVGIEPNPELQQLHQRILRNDPALAGTGPGVPAVRAVRQLPRGIPDFTGRAGELGQLDAMLAEPETAIAVVITAIAGTAGVGKTALAVHWGRRVADRYPDGQLYVNLRGYGAEQPRRPVDALAVLLRGLGLPPDEIPVDADHAGARYRSMLDGKRFLVLLDNARSADQVRPLLPAGPGCLALITSRDRLTGLIAADGARRLHVDALSTEDALDLLRRIVGPVRVAAEPHAAHELAELCCRLPLALRIAAANLLDLPDRRIADHVTDLRAGDRLGALAVEGDPQSAILAAFTWSYRSLPVPVRRLFRLLGSMPGPDVAAEAMAAAAAVPVAETAQALDRLAHANLVAEQAGGRYVVHDLLRIFAQRLQQSEPGSRAAATARLYRYYVSHVDAAARLLYPNMLRLDVPPGASFADGTAALDWMDAERHCLAAAVVQAASWDENESAWLIADGMRGYFWLRNHNVDWLTVAGTALDAARTRGDARAEASAHLNFGIAYNHLGRNEEAAAHNRDALALCERAGWVEGEATALHNLGIVDFDRGRLSLAAEHYGRAAEIYRRLDRRDPLAASLVNLGLVHLRSGALAAADATLGEAEVLMRAADNRIGQAITLHNLGMVNHQQGRYQLAADRLTAARQSYTAGGSVDGEALADANLAEVYRDTGRLGPALDLAGASAKVLHEVGDRIGEAHTLNLLGTIQYRLGRYDEAAEQHQQALDLAGELNSPCPRVEALIYLAAAELAQGRADKARDHAGEALSVATDIGYRVLRAEALTVLANVSASGNDLSTGARLAAEAVDLQRETGHRLGEACALRALASCVDTVDGARHRELADRILAEIGACLDGQQLPAT